MIYTIWALVQFIGILAGIKYWLEGKSFTCGQGDMKIYLWMTALEGIALIMVLVPPSSGLLGGCLFGAWVGRELFHVKAMKEEKVYSADRLGIEAIVSIVFFVLVTLNYSML